MAHARDRRGNDDEVLVVDRIAQRGSAAYELHRRRQCNAGQVTSVRSFGLQRLQQGRVARPQRDIAPRTRREPATLFYAGRFGTAM